MTELSQMDTELELLSKEVTVNGQTVILCSHDRIRWFSDVKDIEFYEQRRAKGLKRLGFRRGLSMMRFT